MPHHGKIVVIRRGGGDGTEFPLTFACLFGRKIDCDIRIQLPQVSKEHCRVEINENKEVILTNLSSVNPTCINGVPMQQSERLKHGDVFTVIDRSFRFEAPPPPSPTKKRLSTSGKGETIQVLQEHQERDSVASAEKRKSISAPDSCLKDEVVVAAASEPVEMPTEDISETPVTQEESAVTAARKTPKGRRGKLAEASVVAETVAVPTVEPEVENNAPVPETEALSEPVAEAALESEPSTEPSESAAPVPVIEEPAKPVAVKPRRRRKGKKAEIAKEAEEQAVNAASTPARRRGKAATPAKPQTTEAPATLKGKRGAAKKAEEVPEEVTEAVAEKSIRGKRKAALEAEASQDDVSVSAEVATKDDDDVQSQTGSDAGSRSGSEAAASSSCAPLAHSLTEAEQNKMTEERINECHRAVTKFVVKGLHPFTTVDAPDFREMTQILNPRYKAPNRDSLANQLIPAWYEIEKNNLMSELKLVKKAAITADGWTSFSQDHYLTVTLHYVRYGQNKEKVLKTKAVYQAQTGPAVAEEIDGILEEFGVREKVVAATVDKAANMSVAVKTLHMIKLPCFAHTLNLGAQKLYNCNTISNWVARIRSVILWMNRSHMAKVILKEKQELLKLPKHMLLLDVKARWNSLFLMMERFCEQFSAIQAAAIEPRLRKPMEKEKLAKMGNEDLRKAEEFVLLMRKHYTSTLAVSSDKSPTCGQILPILQKLQTHYTVQADDSAFVRTVKENIWKDLSKRYQDADVQAFLEEATVLDPRFKSKLDRDEIWDRVREAAVAANSEAAADERSEQGETQRQGDEEDEGDDYTPAVKQRKKTALEELFEEEDRELQSLQQQQLPVSMAQRVRREVQLYRSLPSIPSTTNATLWWWDKRDTLPLLSGLAESYLCVQASSTPSERVFSTAGDTISPERSRILPEKADMLIFLHKNG